MALTFDGDTTQVTITPERRSSIVVTKPSDISIDVTTADALVRTITQSFVNNTVNVSVPSPTSMTVTKPSDITVEVLEKGSRGPQGIQGEQGEQGPAGADGRGVAEGGDKYQVLSKASDTDYDTAWVDMAVTQTVKNVSGGVLQKGTPVHAVTEASPRGQLAYVIAARADTPSSMPATFVLNEDLADESEGQAIVTGYISGVDTSAFAAGDVVYVGETGGYTNVKPTGNNLIQNLGVVIKSHASSGSGMIYGSGRSNDVPNLAEGKFFIGSSTNTLQSIYTLPTSDGTDGQVLTTDGSGSVTFRDAPGGLSDVVDDRSPQLGGNLDGQTSSLFTSTTNGNITLTPNGTGYVNLDGTIKFKRFSSPPSAFEGGMYADDQDNLFLGVSNS